MKKKPDRLAKKNNYGCRRDPGRNQAEEKEDGVGAEMNFVKLDPYYFNH